jgi:acetyltransferase-like isoleucine patch superfamily enzyme
VSPLKLISRVLTRIILWDGQYFRKKMLLTPAVYGPDDRVHLGSGVNLQNVVLNTNTGHIYIGDYSFFGHDCMVLTGKHDPALRDSDRINNHPRHGNDIKIGSGVWVSSRAVILGGVSVADNCVIAAGAVVNKSCLEPGISQ